MDDSDDSGALGTTRFLDLDRTISQAPGSGERRPEELLQRYSELIKSDRFSWTEHHRYVRRLGAGGQGVVYLAERRGAGDFTLPVALKFFSPDRFPSAAAYDDAMGRMARVSARVAQIQQDNLLDVQNLVDRHRIRVMEMEWIDGYDLSQLLTDAMLDRTQQRVSRKRWDYLTNVVFARGESHPRLTPGVAVAIVRDCLAGLAALHRQEIVHGDVKLSNIMIKRTGAVKIIDIGSAFELAEPPKHRMCTPSAAAPEVLEGGEFSPRSDLASLGYMLIEMLSGRSPFPPAANYARLLEAKRSLPQRLGELLPEDVACNELLMSFCRNMIAPDPMKRFPDAEAADLRKGGAAAFYRQLVKGDLASEFDNELRLWLDDLV